MKIFKVIKKIEDYGIEEGYYLVGKTYYYREVVKLATAKTKFNAYLHKYLRNTFWIENLIKGNCVVVDKKEYNKILKPHLTKPLRCIEGKILFNDLFYMDVIENLNNSLKHKQLQYDEQYTMRIEAQRNVRELERQLEKIGSKEAWYQDKEEVLKANKELYKGYVEMVYGNKSLLAKIKFLESELSYYNKNYERTV